MIQNHAAYRNILRAASVFGGVQVFNIIISVIRSKAIALFIGPIGMGVAGLLTAAISLIANCTNLGLETSAVKFISESDSDANRVKIPVIVSVLRKAAWITGASGSLLTIALAPLLSRITFGDDDFAWSFVFLAVILLLKQLTISHLAILQGFRQFRKLANANLFGSLFGLLASLPLYYFLKFDAIVPAMIVSAAAACVAAMYFGRHEIKGVKMPRKKLFAEGRAMLRLGVMLSLSGMAAAASAYAIQIYISTNGGLEAAGFYNAGFLLLNSYVGLIFTAMGTEYLPRLSAVAHDNSGIRTEATTQSISALLMLTPVVTLFMAFAPIVVTLLFSDAFTAMVPMILFGLAGMFFRSVSWSIGFILIAKADSAMFVRTAVGFNILFVVLHIVGYRIGGITGLGAAFALHYLIHLVSLYLIARRRYDFGLTRGFWSVFAICGGLTFSALAVTFLDDGALKQTTAIAIFSISALYSLTEIKSRSGFNFR